MAFCMYIVIMLSPKMKINTLNKHIHIKKYISVSYLEILSPGCPLSVDKIHAARALCTHTTAHAHAERREER